MHLNKVIKTQDVLEKWTNLEEYLSNAVSLVSSSGTAATFYLEQAAVSLSSPNIPLILNFKTCKE